VFVCISCGLLAELLQSDVELDEAGYWKERGSENINAQCVALGFDGKAQLASTRILRRVTVERDAWAYTSAPDE
jgi:hypothetical protein